MGFIYKITNLINDKKYIGKTTLTVEARWKKHCYEVYRNRVQYTLYKAMRKYGIENFSIEEIEEVEDSKLDEREKYWIQYFNSYSGNEQGYNDTYGGEGCSKIDKETVFWLWDNGFSIKQITDEIGHDRSAIRAILQTYDNYSIEESHRRGDNIQAKNRWKKVKQFSLKGELLNTFDNAHDAERQTGVSNKTIWLAVNHKQQQSGGFQWRYEDDPTPVENLSLKKHRISKEVQQLKNNQIIKTFKTAAEASRQTGISDVMIRRACQGKSKTAGGYEWKYKGE